MMGVFSKILKFQCLTYKQIRKSEHQKTFSYLLCFWKMVWTIYLPVTDGLTSTSHSKQQQQQQQQQQQKTLFIP